MDLLASSAAARITALILIFGLVALVVFRSIAAMQRVSHARGMLREISGSGGVDRRESLQVRSRTGWARLIETIEASGLSLADSKPDVLRRKMVAAGYDAPEAPRLYQLIRLLLVFILPATAILVLIATSDEISVFGIYVVGSIMAVLGLYLPAFYIRTRIDRLRGAIISGFPNCLDLMLVCVEAGLGMEAAFDRIAREMVLTEPEVAKLLAQVTLHLRAGASREEALRKMADAAGVDEVRSFATLLIQSDKLGTSIGEALRVFAAEMREKRRMNAEEKAHRLPVLISIPLVACMLPTMVGVLMLPAIIRIVRQLLPQMTGG